MYAAKNLRNWFAALRNRRLAVARQRVSAKRFLPRLDYLEDRLTPADFLVNTFGDTTAVNLITGQDSAGNISLRSAIQAANSIGGSNSITLPAGSAMLSIGGAGEDATASGDLDIKNNLTITGAGANLSRIDASTFPTSGRDRVF